MFSYIKKIGELSNTPFGTLNATKYHLLRLM